jgi:hypothetical protein
MRRAAGCAYRRRVRRNPRRQGRAGRYSTAWPRRHGRSHRARRAAEAHHGCGEGTPELRDAGAERAYPGGRTLRRDEHRVGDASNGEQPQPLRVVGRIPRSLECRDHVGYEDADQFDGSAVTLGPGESVIDAVAWHPAHFPAAGTRANARTRTATACHRPGLRFLRLAIDRA